MILAYSFFPSELSMWVSPCEVREVSLIDRLWHEKVAIWASEAISPLPPTESSWGVMFPSIPLQGFLFPPSNGTKMLSP